MHPRESHLAPCEQFVDVDSRGHSPGLSGTELYLMYCNSQPLLLFPLGMSAASMGRRDPELIAAMEAIGVRFRDKGVKLPQIEAQIKQNSEKASHLVMARLASGNVELSTIQTLCLLNMLEFTGKTSSFKKWTSSPGER